MIESNPAEARAALYLIEAYKDAIRRIESHQASINHLEKMGTSDEYFKKQKKLNSDAIQIISYEMVDILKRAFDKS